VAAEVTKQLEPLDVQALALSQRLDTLIPGIRAKALEALQQDGKLSMDEALDLWDESKGDELCRQKLQKAVSNDEILRQQAEEGIAEFLPELPRATKRLINRLRYLLVIAFARGLLSSGALTPTVVGKWAVFLERWPELASRVIRDPDFMIIIEKRALASEEALVQVLAQSGLALDATEITAFLTYEPTLGPVAATLVHMKAPDTSRQAAVAPPG
jgi:hypothetical protein